jgi:hypothetical protein
MRCNCKICGFSAFASITTFARFEGICRRCAGLNRLFKLELVRYPDAPLTDYFSSHKIVAFNKGALDRKLHEIPLGAESPDGFKRSDWRILEIRTIKEKPGIVSSFVRKVDTVGALRGYARRNLQGKSWRVESIGSKIRLEVYNQEQYEAMKAGKRKSYECETILAI